MKPKSDFVCWKNHDVKTSLVDTKGTSSATIAALAFSEATQSASSWCTCSFILGANPIGERIVVFKKAKNHAHGIARRQEHAVFLFAQRFLLQLGRVEHSLRVQGFDLRTSTEHVVDRVVCVAITHGMGHGIHQGETLGGSLARWHYGYFPNVVALDQERLAFIGNVLERSVPGEARLLRVGHMAKDR